MKRFTVTGFAAIALGGFVITPGNHVTSILQPLPRAHGPVSLIKKGVSTNWSGYAAGTNLDFPVAGTVSDVAGEWIVPSVTCGSGETSYSSMWVGVDGYNNGTVEQLGTESDCSSGTPNYYAWFEMYPQPGYLLNPTLFPVVPGNHITASVTYQTNGNFELAIDSDNSTWPAGGFSIVKKASKAQRTTAEWIIEAPGRSTLPLADFGTAHFTNANWNSGNAVNTLDEDRLVKVGTEQAYPSALGFGGTSFDDTFSNSTTSSDAFVASIRYSFSRKAGGALTVTISIVDNLGDPVDSAEIVGDVNGAPFDITTGTTGSANFTISSPSSGNYTTTISSVTAAGLTWDLVTPPNGYKIK